MKPTKGKNIDAHEGGGSSRMSVEGPVMGLELYIFASMGFGNWFFLLKIFLKFWYDAERLGHESESCGFKDEFWNLKFSYFQ